MGNNFSFHLTLIRGIEFIIIFFSIDSIFVLLFITLHTYSNTDIVKFIDNGQSDTSLNNSVEHIVRRSTLRSLKVIVKCLLCVNRRLNRPITCQPIFLSYLQQLCCLTIVPF